MNKNLLAVLFQGSYLKQVNHSHPYQIRKKNIKNVKNVLILWSITCVKTDEKAKREKSFAGIEDTRLTFDISFVKRQVLSGFNTVLGVEFIERDEACDW